MGFIVHYKNVKAIVVLVQSKKKVKVADDDKRSTKYLQMHERNDRQTYRSLSVISWIGYGSR